MQSTVSSHAQGAADYKEVGDNFFSSQWARLLCDYRNMSIDAGSQERAAIIQALKHLTSLCSIEEDVTLAHGQNQKILFNSGGYSHQCTQTDIRLECVYVCVCMYRCDV